jgi:alpha-tubulin suppressor-like RCC1 family protein
MLRGIASNLLVGLIAACSFNPSPPGVFKCEPDGACPPGNACVGGYCQPEAMTCGLALAAGGDHTCAVLKDGTAWCWGRNTNGQLGDGSDSDRTEPVQVAELTDVTAIAGGGHHSCAIHAGGAVSCWGANYGSQLGNTPGDHLTPVPVVGLSGALDIVAGDAHSCARLDGGSVTCWGANSHGQLGDGTVGTGRGTPRQVEGPAGVTAIAADGSTTCAIDGNQALWCWGDNDEGQLGDGTKTQSPAAKKVISSDVAGVAVGDEFTCALLSPDGKVMCSGANQRGQLGVSPSTMSPSTMVPVPLQGKADAVIAGARFACAIDGQRQLQCWGENDDFELADQLVNGPTPSAYVNVAAAVGGGRHLCALTKGGSISCSGYNGRGEIGDGKRTTRAIPQSVSGLAGVNAIAGGNRYTCAVRDDHTVVCWGRNDSGELGIGYVSRSDVLTPTKVEGVAGATSVATGDHHACALLGPEADRAVVCWGRNSQGELGDGKLSARDVALPVTGLTQATALSVGGAHSCALTTTGVMCWGKNDFGQSGDGQPNALNQATLVNRLPAEITEIATGKSHTCAIAQGKVWCWGSNAVGQLGIGKTGETPQLYKPSPVQTSAKVDLENVDHLSAHGDFTCAHVSTDSLWCWGYDTLGTGTPDMNGVSRSLTAQQVVRGLAGLAATKVATGSTHACALKTDGTVACWGENSVGQVGDPSYTNRTEPFDVPGLAEVRDIAAADQHSCAVFMDNTVKCWGDDSRGQLGDGVASERLPAAIKLMCPP